MLVLEGLRTVEYVHAAEEHPLGLETGSAVVANTEPVEVLALAFDMRADPKHPVLWLHPEVKGGAGWLGQFRVPQHMRDAELSVLEDRFSGKDLKPLRQLVSVSC